MVKGAASQVLQVPPLKSGVYLGYSVCFDVYPGTNARCEDYEGFVLITSLHFTPSIDLAIVKLATCVTLLSQADIKD